MLETLDYTIRIGSTPTFLYFDLYLYSARAAHYVYASYPGVSQRGLMWGGGGGGRVQRVGDQALARSRNSPLCEPPGYEVGFQGLCFSKFDTGYMTYLAGLGQ